MQEKPIYFAVHAKMMMAGVPFSALLIHKENATVLEADWQNDAHPVGLCDLAECCKLNLSYLQSWDIELTKAQFSLVTGQKDPTVDFQLVSERYGSLEIQAMQTQFSMQLFPPAEKQSIDCTKLPFLGNYLSEGDCLELYRVAVDYTAQQVTALADFSLVLFGKKIFEQKEQGRLGEQLAKWVDVNKSVGPVTVHRIGFAMEGQYLGLLLDSSFALGPITVSTLGLCLQVPVDLDFKKTKCSIEGIAVEYSSGGIFLAGGLVCTDGQTERCDGVLQLRAFGLCMSALASYAVTEDETSLFVYAYLRLPTGIGSGFTITGFSAGLGTNRRLLLPDISKVSEFPLIAMATADQPLTSTDQMLRQMQQCLLVEQDSYFGAAGISFQAFGLLDGFALASLSFGKRLEIALLGQCTLQVPEKTKSPLAKVVLPFSVRFLPDEGVFSAQAIIGCGSFLLDPNCHLTGGFACFLWFDGQYKGDFVVTVGGYHPRFRPPPHYPTVDRVGVDWKMDSHLQLTGGLYFSLTPAAIMAGGGLSLTYQLGNLKAWVNAQADFLVQWSPVYYDIQIGVRVGASYRVDFFVHPSHLFGRAGCQPVAARPAVLWKGTRQVVYHFLYHLVWQADGRTACAVVAAVLPDLFARASADLFARRWHRAVGGRKRLVPDPHRFFAATRLSAAVYGVSV